MNQDFELCKKFHGCMSSRRLCHWKDLSGLPKNGLYCFYEKGESCQEHSDDHRRIVYIGINKEDGNFAKRTRDHYEANTSFNRHVLTAWFLRYGPPDLAQVSRDLLTHTEHVGIGNLPLGIRLQFRSYFDSAFSFRYVEVEDKRIDLEEKAIATVAACSVCRPSAEWLGNWSVNNKVKKIGLWNDEYTESYKRLSSTDLDLLCSLS